MVQSDFINPAKRQVFPTTNGFFVKAVNKLEGYITKCRRVGVKIIVHTSLNICSQQNLAGICDSIKVCFTGHGEFS